MDKKLHMTIFELDISPIKNRNKIPRREFRNLSPSQF